MKYLSVHTLPLASNVCGQALREVEKTAEWSVAHVTMEHEATSLLHQHATMTEVYVVTKGHGLLTIGQKTYAVSQGDILLIPPKTPHMLKNGAGMPLEHLVFASPPFVGDDVEVLSGDPDISSRTVTIPTLPPLEDCFDGARIRAYDFGDSLPISFAFGQTASEPHRAKKAHRHRTITEWVYVVDGKGSLEKSNASWGLWPGNWVMIAPGEAHAFRNQVAEELQILCVSSPRFKPEDAEFVD